jgi:hypothetical protein
MQLFDEPPIYTTCFDMYCGWNGHHHKDSISTHPGQEGEAGTLVLLSRTSARNLRGRQGTPRFSGEGIRTPFFPARYQLFLGRIYKSGLGFCNRMGTPLSG